MRGGIAIEGHGYGAIQFGVGEGADSGGGRGTVGGEQGEGCFLGDALIFLGVAVVHSVDRIPRYRREGSTGGEFLGEMDFNGIYAGDVMYDDADLAAILGSRGLPLRVGEGGGEGGCTGFQAGGEGSGSLQVNVATLLLLGSLVSSC